MAKSSKKKIDFTGVIPEKRQEVLYVRVKAANKKFIADFAECEGVSESALVDSILTIFREQKAPKKNRH